MTGTGLYDGLVQFCIFYTFVCLRGKVYSPYDSLSQRVIKYQMASCMIKNKETALVCFAEGNNGYGGFFFLRAQAGRQTSAGVTYKIQGWLPGNYPDSQSALFNQSLVIYGQLKQTLR